MMLDRLHARIKLSVAQDLGLHGPRGFASEVLQGTLAYVKSAVQSPLPSTLVF